MQSTVILRLEYTTDDYQSSKARRSFGDEVFGLNITVLLRATFLVFNNNNIVACNFARFAANDVKGRQVATGNGASSVSAIAIQVERTLKRGHQTFFAPYITDNRSTSTCILAYTCWDRAPAMFVSSS